MAQDEEFLNIEVNQVQELLNRDSLCVVSEEHIFEALMRWVKKDPEMRSIHLPNLVIH